MAEAANEARLEAASEIIFAAIKYEAVTDKISDRIFIFLFFFP